MIARHRKFKFFALTLLASLLSSTCTVSGLAPAPVDFLVPPPPPPGSVVTRYKQVRPQSILPSESRTLPQLINSSTSLPKAPDQHPGLMTRVARWFGFVNQKNAATNDQELGAGTNKQNYYYPKPQQQFASGDKEACTLCNKYPWVPMMLNSIHYPKQVPPANQWDAGKQNQQLPQLLNFYGNPVSGGQKLPQIQHAASSLKQRAVKFNFPLPYVPPPNSIKGQQTPNNIQYSTGPFLPIPVPPLLSNSALPPIYNAQNFLPTLTPVPTNTIQQLPSTEPAHFDENIGEHSEIHVDTAVATQIPSTVSNKDTSFEIVKSHQLVDYISSIEYPASYVPSHSYDITTEVSTVLPANHQADPQISTGQYQHSTLRPDLNQHVPASQLLTDPASFAVANNQHQQPAQQSVIYEQRTSFNQPSQYLEQVRHFEYDNFVAASQQNFQNSSTLKHQQPQYNTNLDAWTLESNDYVYATSTPEILSTTEEATTTFTTELETTTQQPLKKQQQDDAIEFVASIQTNAQQSAKLWQQKSKQRETPKRLLDSPIQHVNGNIGAPRPFTKDPSELNFRLGAKNHRFSETPQNSTPQPPEPTSTYSSIDASGQYAGMSPPSSLPSTYNNNELILPYVSTKNRPRPFETTHINSVTKSPSNTSFFIRSHGPNTEIHTPQESMLVKSHVKPETSTSTTTTPKPRSTKYLTKILASNLRELLQREHEPTKLKPRPNSLDIDINKLQKNIDDWTEQEYTSLSHRPSTPTIRGRSKHIPSEYLPNNTATFKPARQSKTTKGFLDAAELSSSINNLEPLYERESTKHFQYTQITDNHLNNLYTNFESMKSKSSPQYRTTTTMQPSGSSSSSSGITSTSTTTTTTTTTTEKPLYLKPIQNQAPEELWKKAKVSISPKTQEKVYVVTPQPRFFPQRLFSASEASSTSTTTTTTTERPFSKFGSGFKSPRFLVRPTPGNDTESRENSKEYQQSNGYFAPEWFGLKGLSAYIPAQPVEIIDGNSKVLNIVTAPSNLDTTMTTARHNIMDLTKDRHTGSKRKSTMAPSPR